jgi:hypothetical protein
MQQAFDCSVRVKRSGAALPRAAGRARSTDVSIATATPRHARHDAMNCDQIPRPITTFAIAIASDAKEKTLTTLQL